MTISRALPCAAELQNERYSDKNNSDPLENGFEALFNVPVDMPSVAPVPRNGNGPEPAAGSDGEKAVASELSVTANAGGQTSRPMEDTPVRPESQISESKAVPTITVPGPTGNPSKTIDLSSITASRTPAPAPTPEEYGPGLTAGSREFPNADGTEIPASLSKYETAPASPTIPEVVISPTSRDGKLFTASFSSGSPGFSVAFPRSGIKLSDIAESLGPAPDDPAAADIVLNGVTTEAPAVGTGVSLPAESFGGSLPVLPFGKKGDPFSGDADVTDSSAGGTAGGPLADTRGSGPGPLAQISEATPIAQLDHVPEPSRILDQIEPQILKLAGAAEISRNGRSMRIHLNPETLGSVEINLNTNENGTMSAHLVTDNEAARQSLNENILDLRSSLEEAGLQLHELDISCRSFSSSEQGENDGPGAQHRAPAQRSTANVDSSGISEVKGEGDIRLLNLRA